MEAGLWRIADSTWSATCATCVPPLVVAIELTNENCWKPSSLGAIATSHRSDTFSKTRGVPPSGVGEMFFNYIFLFLRANLSIFLLKKTFPYKKDFSIF